MTDRPGSRRGVLEARLAALAVIGLGVVAIVGSTQVRTPGGYAAVGANAMPAVVGVALIGLGAALLLRATLRLDLDHAERIRTEAVATHWPTTGLALAGLVGYAMALGPLGYVVATSVFLPFEARILGSRSTPRDLLVGIGLGVVVYLAFTQLLGVRLPAGFLEPVLP
ncbi:MAG: tripartite tricarboxylate transporter TctB family protein [Chloroflexota bacterium]